MVAPASLAARRLAAVHAAAVSESAGVMPETWNQSAPSKTAAQSNSGWVGHGDGGPVAVVGDRRGALGGAGLDEVDAQPPRATDDVVSLDGEPSQLTHDRVAKGPLRQGGHVARPQPVVGHGHRHVGLTAGERGLQGG